VHKKLVWPFCADEWRRFEDNEAIVDVEHPAWIAGALDDAAAISERAA